MLKLVLEKIGDTTITYYVLHTACHILHIILLAKTAAARNAAALSYHSVRGLYFLAVVFAATIYVIDYILYPTQLA